MVSLLLTKMAATASSANNLIDVVNSKETFGLNCSDKFPFSNALLANDAVWTQSDGDEQLLFHIVFNEAVALQGFKLQAAKGKADEAPKTVKLFVNLVSVSFSDVESLPPAQVFTLTPEMAEPSSPMVPVKQVLFGRINSLTIFIEDNQGGDDVTIVGGLKLIGKPLGSVNVSNLKKVEGHEG